MSLLHDSVQFIRSVVSVFLGCIHILYRAVRTIIFVIKQKGNKTTYYCSYNKYK